MSLLNKQQTRYLNAFNNLAFCLSENQEVWANNSPFQRWVGHLLTNNKAIVALSTTKGTSSRGATEAKNRLKASIAQHGSTICSYAADYAVATGNTELFALVNYSASDISYLRDAEVLGFINGVVEAVTPLVSLPGFKDYPVTAEDLDNIANEAGDFNKMLGKNKNIIISSRVASHQIDALIKDNRNVIIRLGKLVSIFQKDAPGFVEAFYEAKKIDTTGIHHSGVAGAVVDSAGIPVEGATVTLTGKKKTKQATTGSNGTYEMVKFQFGKAKLTIAAPGFDSISVEVTIVRGKVVEYHYRLPSSLVNLKTA